MFAMFTAVFQQPVSENQLKEIGLLVMKFVNESLTEGCLLKGLNVC